MGEARIDDLSGFTSRMVRTVRERGLTAEEVAGLAGLAKSTVTSMMRGDRYPTLWSLMRVRDALGCTWDDLLGDDVCKVRVAHPDMGGFHEYVCGTRHVQFKYRGDLNHCPVCGRRADVRG